MSAPRSLQGARGPSRAPCVSSPASPAVALGAVCARPGPLVLSAVRAPLITHRHSLLGVVCDCAIHSSELCAARWCLRVVRLARVAHRRRASLWLATWLRRDSPRARRRVVGSTCGSVSLLAPCTRGVLCAPLLLSLTALYHLRCAPRVARGVVYHFLWAWHLAYRGCPGGTWLPPRYHSAQWSL